jgi:hypothetical protein
VTVSKSFADGERGKVKDTEVNDEEDSPDAKTNPALPRGRRLSTGFINTTTIIFSCLIGHPHADQRLKQILTKNQNFKTRLSNLSEYFSLLEDVGGEVLASEVLDAEHIPLSSSH